MILTATKDASHPPKEELPLLNNVETFHQLCSAIPDSVFLIDDSEKIIFCNKSAQTLLHTNIESILGTKFNQFIAKKDRDVVKKNLNEIVKKNMGHATIEVAAIYERRKEFPIEIVFSEITINKTHYIIAVIRDITGRCNIKSELEYRLAFERVLNHLITLFANIHPNQTDEKIYEAIKSLGKFIDSDFCDLCLFAEDNTTIANHYAWQEKDRDIKGNIAYFPKSTSLPWLYKTLIQTGIILLSDLKTLPQEANHEKKLWEKQKTHTLLFFPLMKQKKLLGFLCFRTVTREINLKKNDFYLLSTITEIFLQALERKKIHTEKKQRQKQRDELLLKTIQAIAQTIEMRDPYTAGHQQRVSILAHAIAVEMNLPKFQIEGLRLGASIHDIGKIYVPAEILNRPGKLNHTEFALIKTHPKIGYDLIKEIDFPWPIAKMILEHHERLDGSGYPNHLKENEISIESKILAVADVVEAATSHRPYRPAQPKNIILSEIESLKEIYFDPDVVDICLYLLNKKDFNY